MSEDFKCGEEYKPLIPNGTYKAQCVGHNESFYEGKARKQFLHFRIIEDSEYFGKEIFMAFNMPGDGEIKQGSKYYKNWVMVNGWKKPSRNAKMSPRIFLKKVYKVKTRTVKPLHNEEKMPENFWYSVVDSILEVIVEDLDPDDFLDALFSRPP